MDLNNLQESIYHQLKRWKLKPVQNVNWNLLVFKVFVAKKGGPNLLYHAEIISRLATFSAYFLDALPREL